MNIEFEDVMIGLVGVLIVLWDICDYYNSDMKFIVIVMIVIVFLIFVILLCVFVVLIYLIGLVLIFYLLVLGIGIFVF